jgi:predicted nucleic-acid-binding Zn-ribbon protein
MKTKIFNISGLFIILTITRFIVSCAPESCIEETTSFVNTTFYKSSTNKLTAPDSITVFGTGRDTIKLYNKATKLSTIKLPLDASLEECGFIIKINGLTDTLRFEYEGYPHLISKACGFTFFYSLNSVIVSGNAADTIIIRNNNITTLNGENIRIYY